MVQEILRPSLESELASRKRDFANEINIDSLSRQMSTIQESGLRVIPLESKNKAQFAQIITPNMRHLVKMQYLTTAEQSFLTAISGYIEMHSNAIVSFENDKLGQYLKVVDIANLLNYSERQSSRLINALINKGIIYECVDSLTIRKYGRVVEERPLFLNPEIIFCGNRNRINATLCRLIINTDHLERKGAKLPWKLWIEPGYECGKLYRRDTWLRKKKRPQNKRKWA